MKLGVDCIGVSVGALVFNDEGQLLLTKRSMKARNEKGKWEAPGGAVEFGERREQAIRREIKEELGVEIEIRRVLATNDEILKKEKQHWVPTTYVAHIKRGQRPKIMEPEKCDKIGWFSIYKLPKPLSRITELDVKSYKAQLLPRRVPY